MLKSPLNVPIHKICDIQKKLLWSRYVLDITGHFGAMTVSNGQSTSTIMQLVDFVTTSPSLPYAYFFRCRLFYMFA